MRYLISSIFVLSLFAQETAISPDAIVLTVDQRKYTKAEFEEIVRAQNSNPSEAAKRLVNANSFARIQALAEVARQRKLDQRPDIRAKLELYEASLLNQALFTALVEEIHKDESLARKRYESQQHIAEERHLRQILIRTTESKPAGKLTPQQALSKLQSLRTRIEAGAKFAELAAAQSDDEKSKGRGGDIGMQSRTMLLPEFGEAAFRLKAGEVSEPVQTKDGYHLILVEKITPPAFERVRKSIEYELARQRMAEIVVTGIKLNPDYFGK